MTKIVARASEVMQHDRLTGGSARANALIAIEHFHQADVGRSVVDDVFTISESFRRPDGLWWIRAFSRRQQRELESLVVPNQQFTRLKAGTNVVLTRISCGESVLFEAALA